MKTIRLLVAILALAGPAHAFNIGPIIGGPICLRPDLAKCQDAAYQDTECGRRNRAFCSDLMLDAAADQTANAPVGETVDGQGEIISTREVAATPARVAVRGFHGAFGGQVLRQQRESNAGVDWDLFFHRLERLTWDNNGDRVESCDEYVYERYYEYSAFEDEMGRFGTDWWAIYDAAHADGGIMTHTWLKSKDRRRSFRLPSLSPQNMRRNAFATVPLDDMQAVNDTLRTVVAETYPNEADDIDIFDFDADLVAATQASTRAPVAHTWANHRARAERLRAVDGHTLVALEEAADRFNGVIARQEHASQAMIDAERGITLAEGLCRFDPRNCRVSAAVRRFVDAANDLADANRELQRALREGQAMGCVEDEDIGLCDWSPRTFVRQLEGRFLAEREEDHDRCMVNTGDDFRPVADASDFRTALCQLRPTYSACRYASRWPAGNDFRDGTYWVDRYFAYLEYFIRYLPLDTNPATGAPRLAESALDSGENGDDRFGVDFEYDLGWNVSDLGDGDNYCEADVAVQATVTANVTAFGFSTGENGRPDMFEATLALVAADDPNAGGRQRMSVETDVSVYGQSYHTITGRLDTINIVRNPRLDASTPRARLNVPVAGIPLYLEGWISGAVGADLSVRSNGDRDCANGQIDIGVDAHLEPYATVDGHATAGLDFFIVKAGVGVDLNLLDLRLPFDAEVGLQLSPDESALTASADLNLTISTLAGRVKVFIDPFIGDGWSKVLFSWKGISKSYDLFGTTYVLPLNALSAALRGV